MARRDRHRRGGRVTPKGTRPEDRRWGHAAGEPEEPELFDDVRERLARGPVEVLDEVSGLLAAVEISSRPLPGQRRSGPETPSPEELLVAFAAVDRLETTALLAGFAALCPDEALRARAFRALARRDHPLPAWLAELGSARAGRVAVMTDAFGDGEEILVEVVLADGAALTTIASVDHNAGGAVTDGFALPLPLDEVVAKALEARVAAGEVSWLQLAPADARARIEEAVELGALLWPPPETDTWPMSRPLVQWAARLLPGGGQGYVRPEWDGEALAALTEDFFTSRFGKRFDDPDHRSLLESILWFGTDYGPGDPLRWSPTSVELLLGDWIPRKLVAPVPYLAQAPELLRAFVGYCHVRRGVRPALTAETLEAVDRLEADYLRTIAAPRLQGPAALLARAGLLDPDGELPGAGGHPWEQAWDDDDDDDPGEDLGMPADARALFEALGLGDPVAGILAGLASSAGGDEQLRELDDRPLPDEELDWEGIEADIAPRVARLAAALDRACESLLDVEHRTACRRLLARVARAAPDVLRRDGRDDRLAAALCWAVARANGAFDAGGKLMVKDLLAAFGVTRGSVSGMARGILATAGVGPPGDSGWREVSLGDPALLVSARRRRIIESRELAADWSRYFG